MTQDFSQLAGTLAAGDQVAGYQIGAQIGTGGMAVVYRALDQRLDRHVALKVLAPRLAEDDGFRQRFIRESRAAAGVDHPHIIPVFEAGEADGVLFIAMRYVSGGDVRTLIQSEGRLSTARTSAIASQAAAALDAAHAHGLVHRDVKPGNILLDSAGGRDHVYLADFGLSKHSVGANTLTGTGQFMGTLDYVSPEQIQGHRADGRADQYALACTVVEMLCGKPPYTRDESMALLWAQLEAPPPLVTELRADLPAELNDVISTALSKSPNDRYPTCLDFATALAQACARPPVVLRDPTELAAAVPPVPVTPPAVRPGWAGDTRPEPLLAPIPAAEETAAAPPRPPAPVAAPPAKAAAFAGTPAEAASFAGPDQGRISAAPGRDRIPATAGQAASPPRPAPARQPGSPARPGAVAGSDRPQAGWAGPAGPGRPQAGWAGPAGPGQPQAGWAGPADPGQPPAGTWPAARDPHLVPQRQRPRRTGRRVVTAVLATALVAGLGLAGYKLLNRRAADGASLPPVYVTKTVPPSPSAPSAPSAASLTPAGTVQAYFAAINVRNYKRAWRLNTVVHSNQDYQQFVESLAGTVHDTVQVQSTTGNVVTAQLAATQKDGKVKTFQGTYTVTDGIISGTSVQQVS